MQHHSAPLIAFRPGFYSPGGDDGWTQECEWTHAAVYWHLGAHVNPLITALLVLTLEAFLKKNQTKLLTTSSTLLFHCWPQTPRWWRRSAVLSIVRESLVARPHQCCIGSFLITFAVRLDTGWWIMAPTRPHLGDVSLVFPCEVCRWLYTDTNTNTHAGWRTTNRSPSNLRVPTYGVLLYKQMLKWTILAETRVVVVRRCTALRACRADRDATLLTWTKQTRRTKATGGITPRFKTVI